MQWTSTGSLNKSQTPVAACLLPDGRVLAVRGAPQASEIYDPIAGAWSLTGTMTGSAGKALLLPNGKVLISYNWSIFSAELFDPDTGGFQPIPGINFKMPIYGSSTVLLSDGRVLLAGTGSDNRIYDPITGMLSAAPRLANSNSGEWTLLLPDGRVLAYGATNIGPYSPSPDWVIYDPVANKTHPASISTNGAGVLMPDGRVFISGTAFGLAPGISGTAEIYDPVKNRAFMQNTAKHPGGVSILLTDGRIFGISSSKDPSNSGTFALIYTPDEHENPMPVISSAIPNKASASPTVALDIHGKSFVSNSAVQLGNNKLVALYLGSKHLVAFVPAALRSSLNLGIAVNNPGQRGGTTSPVPVR
jgi:hypothetical protein